MTYPQFSYSYSTGTISGQVQVRPRFSVPAESESPNFIGVKILYGSTDANNDLTSMSLRRKPDSALLLDYSKRGLDTFVLLRHFQRERSWNKYSGIKLILTSSICLAISQCLLYSQNTPTTIKQRNGGSAFKSIVKTMNGYASLD